MGKQNKHHDNHIGNHSVMERDSVWITRFEDNRLKGLLSELREVIEDSDNQVELYKLSSSLRLGFANFAGNKSQEMKEKERFL